ncbi:MAG TPA: hypothetical protein VM327_09050 [Candidatus Thermoplasmatota archaeon]|nr:hypothetical protein [Candidatus Thermoplasmatota archaeon]
MGRHALALVLMLLAGCATPTGTILDQGIEAVRVQAYGNDGVTVHVRGGTSDPDTWSGIGRAPPFDGVLHARYYAGMKAHPAHAGLVHTATHRIEAADFQDDDGAALYNDVPKGERPMYGSDDISFVVLDEDEASFDCGGFYFLAYEVVVDGRRFTGEVDFHLPAC